MEQANPKFEKATFVCFTLLGVLMYFVIVGNRNGAGWRDWVFVVLAAIAFVAVSKFAWRLGDWFRRFTMPSMYFAANSWDMFGKRLGYMVGPQIAALGITWFVVLIGTGYAAVAVGLLKK